MKIRIFTLIFAVFIALLLNNAVLYSQWFQLSSGTTETLMDIYFSDLNTGIAVGNNGKIIRTTNGGQNWISVSSLTSNFLYSIDFPAPMTGYTAGLSGTVRRTYDCGNSWEPRTGCGINIRSIAFLNVNTGITAGGGTLMCFTNDGGQNWSPRNVPQFAVTGVTFINSTTLLTSATDMPGAVIYKSTNTGFNWSTVMIMNNSGMNVTHSLSYIYFKNPVTGFCTGSSNNYGASSGNIYRTTNAGDNWSIAGSTPAASGSGLYGIHFGSSDTGFVVGNNGVIMCSTNGGANWYVQSSTVTTSLSGVYMLNAQTGYICGSNGVILKTTNGGVVGFAPISNKVPGEFSLEQNYPNPFNPVTRIKFSISFSPLEGSISALGRGNGQHVTLIVYDAPGRVVETLVNQQLSPGTYEVEWNAGNYPSGMYFYTLISENFKETKKLVLLK